MTPIQKNPALVLIDIQNGFRDPAWGKRNNLDAEENMARLLRHWRNQGWPIVHVQHLSTKPTSSLRAGQPGAEFQDCVIPLENEIVVQKNVNSAFIGTQLETILRGNEIYELVMVGLVTDHCVSTTANLGFTVTIALDATATFNRIGWNGEIYDAETVHALALASLNQEFAKIELTSTLLGD